MKSVGVISMGKPIFRYHRWNNTRATLCICLMISSVMMSGGCSSEVPQSSASYGELNTEVGCGSTIDNTQKKALFKSEYRNHRMIWSGEVLHAAADTVLLNIDGSGTPNLQVRLTNRMAGTTLEKGNSITISFVMKKMGDCSLPFSGENGVIESTIHVSYSPAETFDLIQQRNNLYIIDVRSPGELREGKIENSVLIPITDIVAGNYIIPKDRPLLLYCATGGRSYAAMQLLAQNGYTEIYNLQGGISAWKQANRPLIY